MNIFATSLWTPYLGIEFSEDKYITNALWRDVLLKYGNITFTELEKVNWYFYLFHLLEKNLNLMNRWLIKLNFYKYPL